MANWVTNKVTFLGTKKENTEILNFIKGNNEHEIIDFKTVIPIPDHIFTEDLGPEERKKYGKNNWYDWCAQNWGTKWNAHSSKIIENIEQNTVINFLTPWSAPTPVFKKLTNIFPDVDMILRWADEDMGFNIGEITCFDGKFQENSYTADKNGNLAWNIYIDVTRNIDCLNLDKNGNWQRKDCTNCELCD